MQDTHPEPPASLGDGTPAPHTPPPRRVMAVPATVIYFTTYDQLRDYLRAQTGSRGHHIPLLAGALARREYPPTRGTPVPTLSPCRRAQQISWLSVPHGGHLPFPARCSDSSGMAAAAHGLMPGVISAAVGAVTVISPLELIRTKMQSRQLSYRELGLCIQSAVAQDGWMSLWRGWGPTVLRDVPFSGTAAVGRAGQWHWETGGMEEHGTRGQRAGRLVCLGCLIALVFPLSSQLSTGLTMSW